MATYPIRQLADNGGTAQFVPVTAPEAVQFPDGSNLNTFIGSVATIESNPVAANHAVGEFLCVNGQVYEVIDAITAGDSISLGENVQVTNLGSKITALTYPSVSLNSSNDMNSVDCGTYYQSGSSMPSNSPSGANNAFIIVLKARSIDRIQLWISVNTKNIQMRVTSDWSESTGTGTNWSSWATL